MRLTGILLAVALLVTPLAAAGQQAAKVARIGYLATGPLEFPEQRSVLDAFREGLRELGYVEGQNIVIEVREAAGAIERFPELARELVRLKVDVIVATNSLTGRAVRGATSTIPTVVPIMGDPVGDGLVASLARPGGNITGLTFIGPQLVPKRLELLKEALPGVSRVAGLWHPGAYGGRTQDDMMKQAEAAARTLGLQLRLVAVRRPDELGRAFATIAGTRVEAVFGFPSPMLFTERRRIVELATKQRLPSMFQDRAFVELGGLLSYGADITALSRRGAMYVDKILKGARPADLPVELPTKFELVVNLRTAKALGLTIPPALLARADRVIE
jgi:putative ABC transport system substrate-binding protein